ncbi:MAG: ABC transporter ATP-binding protein [Gammaproteobacteria bacterium]|nr:ABC transporter ATP-binding protein [Gammaproteobacteria bacterium]
MLEAIDLTKRYGDIVALDQLNLKVGPGEICCLLGANGAGKTTTIQLFLDFIPRSGGVARICGHDVVEEPVKTKSLLAYIPEVVNLYGSLSGRENLEYFSEIAGVRLARPQSDELGARAGLQEGVLDRPVSSYSKGMRQKIGIAIALAKGARVLIMDEPLSGLDPKAANEFSTLLKDVAAEGVAALMATHDVFRAKEVGSHIGIMKRGRLVDHLPTSDIDHADLEQLYLKHMHD